jgi:adenylyl-sulfate kinase
LGCLYFFGSGFLNKNWLIWLTGLPGAGKSTLAEALVERLRTKNLQVFWMDGDHFRQVVSRDLGFSSADRSENLHRVSSLAQLLVEGRTNVVAAFVSPYRADRIRIRELFPSGTFAEVFVRCPLEICEERDPKGLYARARCGEIPNFTGISSPYEAPLYPDLVLDTEHDDVESCVKQLEALALGLEATAAEPSYPQLHRTTMAAR